MQRAIDALNRVSWLANWPVRLTVATTFLYHGLPKMMTLERWGNPMVWGVPTLAIGMLEVGGALFLLWGAVGPDWATRIGGLLIVPVMLVAVFVVHLKNGWSASHKGIEWQMLLLSASIMFVLQGNGTNARPAAAESEEREDT